MKCKRSIKWQQLHFEIAFNIDRLLVLTMQFYYPVTKVISLSWWTFLKSILRSRSVFKWVGLISFINSLICVYLRCKMNWQAACKVIVRIISKTIFNNRISFCTIAFFSEVNTNLTLAGNTRVIYINCWEGLASILWCRKTQKYFFKIHRNGHLQR